MSDAENVASGSAGAGESSCQSETSAEDKEILTNMEKIMKLVYSQREWESYLLDKLEKQEKAKENPESTKGAGLFQKLKNYFKTAQESKFFLEEETEKYMKEHPKDEIEKKVEHSESVET